MPFGSLSRSPNCPSNLTNLPLTLPYKSTPDASEESNQALPSLQKMAILSAQFASAVALIAVAASSVPDRRQASRNRNRNRKQRRRRAEGVRLLQLGPAMAWHFLSAHPPLLLLQCLLPRVHNLFLILTINLKKIDFFFRFG